MKTTHHLVFVIKERVIRQCHVNFASAYDYNND
jgi:hypothetical protein